MSENKNSPEIKQPWYKNVWVKITGICTALTLLMSVLLDGFSVWDRFDFSKPKSNAIFVVRPNNIIYDIDRLSSNTREEIELNVETANLTGVIEDSIKIDKIVCIDSSYIRENRSGLPTFQTNDITISNKILSLSKPTSIIKLDVLFYLFYELAFSRFYEHSKVHVYDVYIDIPVTLDRITEIRKAVVPVYITK